LEQGRGTRYGSVSPDGVQWTTTEPMKVDLPRRVFVGVAAGYDTPNAFEPTFEEFRVYQMAEDR
jgi:hypothetical protein